MGATGLCRLGCFIARRDAFGARFRPSVCFPESGADDAADVGDPRDAERVWLRPVRDSGVAWSRCDVIHFRRARFITTSASPGMSMAVGLGFKSVPPSLRMMATVSRRPADSASTSEMRRGRLRAMGTQAGRSLCMSERRARSSSVNDAAQQSCPLAPREELGAPNRHRVIAFRRP